MSRLEIITIYQHNKYHYHILTFLDYLMVTDYPGGEKNSNETVDSVRSAGRLPRPVV